MVSKRFLSATSESGESLADSASPTGSDTPQARNDLCVNYHHLEENFFQLFDRSFLPKTESYYGDLGTWARKGSVEYPKENAVCEFNHITSRSILTYNIPGKYANPYCLTFNSQDYDTITAGPQFEVKLVLNKMSSVYADGSRASDDEDLAKNRGREWYFDHSTATIDKDGINIRYSDKAPGPSREHPIETKGTDGSANIEYHYLSGYVKPGQGIGFITNGFEKDSREKSYEYDTEEFTKNWCKFWFDVGTSIPRKKYLEPVMDILGAIRNGIFTNDDDPMNPCANVFTYGFLKGVWEKYDGWLAFDREVT